LFVLEVSLKILLYILPTIIIEIFKFVVYSFVNSEKVKYQQK